MNTTNAIENLLITADPQDYRTLLLNAYLHLVESELFKGLEDDQREYVTYFVMQLSELLNQDNEEFTAEVPEFLRVHSDYRQNRRILCDCLTAWTGSKEWPEDRLTDKFSQGGEVIAFTNLIQLFN